MERWCWCGRPCWVHKCSVHVVHARVGMQQCVMCDVKLLLLEGERPHTVAKCLITGDVLLLETSRTASQWKERIWSTTLSVCSWPWRWWGSCRQHENSQSHLQAHSRHFIHILFTLYSHVYRSELNCLSRFSLSCRIFSLLSAILHLGNIRYKKKTYRDDSIDICNPDVLPIVSELLEV